jgi:hypothetical protein
LAQRKKWFGKMVLARRASPAPAVRRFSSVPELKFGDGFLEIDCTLPKNAGFRRNETG